MGNKQGKQWKAYHMDPINETIDFLKNIFILVERGKKLSGKKYQETHNRSLNF